MISCIYQGHVHHQRLTPVEHKFRYRTWMLYLDLAEWNQLQENSPLVSHRRLSPLSLLRTDHLGDPELPLERWVRDQVYAESGLILKGPVRLLTQLRQWGQYFSPLNLYYCWEDTGGELAAILAEVSNIPWGEKHAYLLWEGNRTSSGSCLAFENAKSFHVSPFMGMKQSYSWHLQEPGENLRLSIQSQEEEKPLFQARLDMRRKEISTAALAWQMLRQPLPSVQIVAAIYYQAFQLWWKKCPVYPHPNSTSAPAQKSV